MKQLKKIRIIYPFLLYLALLVIFMTILSLIFGFNKGLIKFLCLFCLSLYSLFMGIKVGKRSENLAYRNGFKQGLFEVGLLLLISFIFFNFKFNLERILYYLIIVIVSVFGAIIGINKKNKR